MIKRGIVFFLSTVFFITLVACSSSEEKEVLEYHNDLMKYSNPKLEEIDELGDDIEEADTNEEAYEIEDDELMPLVEDIKDYLEKQEPEEDITKEYHELRADWADKYYEGFQAKDEAYEALLDGPEDEVDDLFADAEDKLGEANEDFEEANEKWDHIVDKYDFEEESE